MKMLTKKQQKYIKRQININAEERASNFFCSYVLDVVSKYYNVDPMDVRSRSRKGKPVKVRHICFYLIKDIIDLSYVHIGKYFNRDHSTVLLSMQKIEGYMNWDKRLIEDIEKIKAIINEGMPVYEDSIPTENEFYYIDLNNFISVKHKSKAIILSGFSKEEALRFFIKNEIINEPCEHKNTGIYVFEEKENSLVNN